MNKTLIAAACLATVFLTMPARADIIDVTIDASSPTGNVVPNTTGAELLAFDITAPAASALEVTSFDFLLELGGSVTVDNLALWQDGSPLGGPIASPGSENGFSIPFLIGQNQTLVFQILGDVGSGTGSIQISIPMDGIGGTELASEARVFGPDSQLDGPSLTVTSTPEPASWMLLLPLAILAVAWRQHFRPKGGQ